MEKDVWIFKKLFIAWRVRKKSERYSLKILKVRSLKNCK